MISESSPVKDYYPVDFKTDLNGKMQEWEAVVLIPFIDEVSNPFIKLLVYFYPYWLVSLFILILVTYYNLSYLYDSEEQCISETTLKLW